MTHREDALSGMDTGNIGGPPVCPGCTRVPQRRNVPRREAVSNTKRRKPPQTLSVRLRRLNRSYEKREVARVVIPGTSTTNAQTEASKSRNGMAPLITEATGSFCIPATWNRLMPTGGVSCPT